MKRTAILTVIFLVFTLAGCGAGNETSEPVIDTPASAVETVVDGKADALLWAMSEKLAAAESIHIAVERTVEEGYAEGMTAGTVSGEVFLVRPNRLAAEIKTEGARGLVVYEGTNVTIADLEANAYASVPAPATVDEALAMLVQDYDYEPPLADFLVSDPYAGFLAELQNEDSEIKSGKHAGMAEIRGVPAHHLVFNEEYIDWELWIAEETLLPLRFVIIATMLEGLPKLQMDLLEIEMDGPIPATTFDFVPPEGAVRIEMPIVEEE